MNDSTHAGHRTPPPGPPPSGTHQQTGRASSGNAANFYASLRRLDFRRRDGWLGGVCGGLGARTGVDPLVFRAGFVLLGLLFGAGVFLYLLAWVLVPDTSERTHLENAFTETDPTSIVLTSLAGVAALGALPWWGGGGLIGDGWFGWWLASVAVTGLLLWGLYALWQERDPAGPSGPAGSPQHPSAHPTPEGASMAEHSRDHSSEPTGAALTTTVATRGSTVEAGDAGHRPDYPQVHQWTAADPPSSGAASGPSGGDVHAPPPSSPPPSAPPPSGPHTPGSDGPTPAEAPSRGSGGPVVALIVTGLALASYGLLDWAAAAYDWPGQPATVAVIGTLAVLGLALVVIGLAGRTGGFTGFLSSLVLVTALMMAPFGPDFRLTWSAGERTWAPVSVASDQDYRLGAGEAVLDLRMLDREELEGQRIRADVNLGSLTLLLPPDLTVQVNGRSTVGQIDLDQPNDPTSGINSRESAVIGPGPEIDLVVDATVGVGSIDVERNNR